MNVLDIKQILYYWGARCRSLVRASCKRRKVGHNPKLPSWPLSKMLFWCIHYTWLANNRVFSFNVKITWQLRHPCNVGRFPCGYLHRVLTYISCRLTIGIRWEICSRILCDVAWLSIRCIRQPRAVTVHSRLCALDSCTLRRWCTLGLVIVRLAMSTKESAHGTPGPSTSGEPSITIGASSLAELMQTIGSSQVRLEEQIAQFQAEMRQGQEEAAVKALKRARYEKPYSFKKKGNEAQALFNAKLDEM